MEAEISHRRKRRWAMHTEGNKEVEGEKLIYRSARRKRRGGFAQERTKGLVTAACRGLPALPAATELFPVTVFRFPVWKGVEEVRGRRAEGQRAEGEICLSLSAGGR